MHLISRPSAVAAVFSSSHAGHSGFGTRLGATVLGTAQCPVRLQDFTSPQDDGGAGEAVTLLRLDPTDRPWLSAQAERFERSAPVHRTRVEQTRYYAALNAMRQAQLHLCQLPTELNAPPGPAGDRERHTLVAVRGSAGPLLDPDRHAMIGILHGELPLSPRRQEAQVLWLASGLNQGDHLRGVGQVLVSQFYRLCDRPPVRHILLTALTRTGRETQPNPFYRQLGMIPVWRYPEHLRDLSPAYRDTLALKHTLYGDATLHQLYLIPRRKAQWDAERIEHQFHWAPALTTPPPPPPPAAPTVAPRPSSFVAPPTCVSAPVPPHAASAPLTTTSAPPPHHPSGCHAVGHRSVPGQGATSADDQSTRPGGWGGAEGTGERLATG